MADKRQLQPICYFTTNKVIFQLESTLILKRVSSLLLLHSRHNLVLFLFPLHKPTAEQTNWTQFSPSHCCDTLKLKDCASSSLGEKCHFKSGSTWVHSTHFFCLPNLTKVPKTFSTYFKSMHVDRAFTIFARKYFCPLPKCRLSLGTFKGS